ncbi:unnamed protein product [Urochloa humidicola]
MAAPLTTCCSSACRPPPSAPLRSHLLVLKSLPNRGCCGCVWWQPHLGGSTPRTATGEPVSSSARWCCGGRRAPRCVLPPRREERRPEQRAAALAASGRSLASAAPASPASSRRGGDSPAAARRGSGGSPLPLAPRSISSPARSGSQSRRGAWSLEEEPTTCARRGRGEARFGCSLGGLAYQRRAPRLLLPAACAAKGAMRLVGALEEEQGHGQRPAPGGGRGGGAGNRGCSSSSFSSAAPGGGEPRSRLVVA